MLRRLLVLLLGTAVAAAAEEVDSPAALLTAGEAAATAQDWPQAAEHFQRFLDTYGDEPALAEAVARVQPRLALARIRLGEFGAAGELVSTCLAQPKLEPRLRDELAFWHGILLLQVEAHEEARAALLAYFQTPEFQSPRKVETILLYGSTFALEGRHEEAAAFFAQQSGRLWQHDREAALRAQILRLHALLAVDQLAAARELALTLQPHLDQVTQIVSLHSLLAELGGRLLDAGRHHEAIACLQRVWPAERLRRHQETRLTALRLEIEAMRQRSGNEPLIFQRRGVLARTEREQRHFAATADFDLGVRLRLGYAWLGLERWREAALVLEAAQDLPGTRSQQAQAGLVAMQCWQQVGRHNHCIAAAQAWLKRFGADAAEPTLRARFLLAQARYDAGDFPVAAADFEALAVEKHALAAQAGFLAGMARLMSDDNTGAARSFRELLARHSQAPIAEEASHWLGLALSFEREYTACRDHLATHLHRYGENARHREAAVFRRAYCRHALGDREGALEEFKTFLREHPEAADADEARVLCGDLLCAQGELDHGLEHYRAVGEGAWFEPAHFKIGQVFKLRRDWDGMRRHHEAFITARPHSRRLAEAVFWCGQASLAQDRPDEARADYWRAIEAHGDQPEHHGVEDVLLALPRLHRGGAARLELRRDLLRRRQTALAAGKRTLTARLHWLEAQLQPSDRPRLGQADFLMAASLLDVRRQHPRVIADCADASRMAGSRLRARELYTELLRWHPRAVEAERALAGLGWLTAADGDPRAALDWFSRCEKRATHPELRGQVRLERALLLAGQDRAAEAEALFRELLADKTAAARTKAETLLAWGELWEQQGEALKAAALYERVYLGHSRQRDLAARAYLARGLVLETLGHKPEAVEVLRELVASDALQGLPEQAEAARRLQRRTRSGNGETS
jgi:tetratricopeptide (TPR) repeat protein